MVLRSRTGCCFVRGGGLVPRRALGSEVGGCLFTEGVPGLSLLCCGGVVSVGGVVRMESRTFKNFCES